ncbi:MAG: cell division FtsZ family protein [Akkermansiaceae bacterium]|jgi:cell division protein FtsZ|nr:cell division FtsZ family protein [Akkermansiaceae bacterium]
MITYSRDAQQTIPGSAVRIVGLGGAGCNMLERIALDGLDGAELLAVNTDIRTLGSCLAPEKVQLGANLTKGLGTGGDPDLGHQAVMEAEAAVRAALAGRRIVFICVGLGGGTGSGAAPIVTRIAREEGAFVVVFATMPFAFEGKRRRDQAETALNELAVLSNALVTFDNNRMGELVLAKQGIHEAFVAADQMICESIKAVIRLVVRPGLINVGLDDLMSALRTTRSRCLFGSGMANGKDRASKALRNALASPLLDQGTLLKDAQTVLVHLCGGEDLTLFEVELLMQRLQKFVPEKAHVLFGAAVDPSMGDSLSLTLISALPEDSLAMAPRDSLSRADDEDNPLLDPSQGFTTPPPRETPVVAASTPPPVKPAPASAPAPEKEEKVETPSPARPPLAAAAVAATLFDVDTPFAEPAPAANEAASKPAVMVAEFVAVEEDGGDAMEEFLEAKPAAAEPEVVRNDVETTDDEPALDDDEADLDELDQPDLEAAGFSTLPPKRPPGSTPWTIADGPKPADPLIAIAEAPKLKLGIKTAGPQSELSLDAAPRGRFEGENPNVFEGEDLDLPPFLRKKKA